MKKFVNSIVQFIINVLCRVEDSEIYKVPKEGPLILIGNHVNFLEVPVMYLYLRPRDITGFAAARSWKHPLFGFLFNLWDAIPLRRGEADISALKKGLEALREGRMMAIAPEGTRSGDGKLQVGHPGVILLALKSGVPLLPVGYYGGENFWTNLVRFRRTDFHIVVGDPFVLKSPSKKISAEVREKMLTEIMYELATILPPQYRGVYSDLTKHTHEYVQYI
ncbi:MAG: 1-acyl-sn-glycerol-3-phosphate acyltransferase [Anaerolineales bacterium]|nr:1-acyl-sn-glycerol-3-phosphate acyltransferase [Anaerolineales bacterium]